ncbi:chymotrypsin-2-like [Eupeodes corollae]|uniref:chymotrypsin-2-like n=1 Tax=Eupeodes corollae TaxID=290404 RepID=UPI0024925E52|nr:chymotrypsin-2-like [Eupeodes corollae]
MRLLLIVTVLCLLFNAIPGKRVRSQSDGHQSINNSSLRLENRIVGGEVVPDGFAPYHVSLQTIIGSHFCSGTIINDRWILTAGHCVMGWNPSNFLISSGSNDLWEPEAYYYPEKVFIHCNYDKPLYHNDIALVRLETKIEFDAKTQPIDIATELLPKGSKALITGWGKSELTGDYSQDLRKLDVDYIEYRKCKEMYKGDNGVDVGHICSLSANTETGVCHGDSGAPLVSDGKLVGIVNWGEPCAKGLPDVHASVSFYHNWINTTMSGCKENLFV